MTEAPQDNKGLRSLVGLIAGPMIFAGLLSSTPPDGLPGTGWGVVAITALMVTWWVSEAVPVAVTALVPIVALPLLGIVGLQEATAPYAHPLIFLFLGGFLIAKAVERWRLHRRIALNILGIVGSTPSLLIGGFMGATAVLSMWLSNTATSIMMLPIALSVIGLLGHRNSEGTSSDGSDRFAITLLLGIAYAASIGGLATLIGTPPNALLAAFMSEKYGIEIGFAQWMLFGLPLATVLLALTWVLLTRVIFRVEQGPIPGVSEIISQELASLGPLRREERLVAIVFIGVAALWIFRPLAGDLLLGGRLSDTTIAVLGGLCLFLIPTDLRKGQFLMDWDTAKRLPWGVLVLFGGGLSLASAIQSSGLAAWIGNVLAGCTGWPVVALILLVTTVVVFLTEVTSNTATASVFIPIAATLGACVSIDPAFFAIPVALAASCAFMMPVATPPNAIIYSSGRVSIPQMAKAGLLLNVVCILVITGAAHWTAGWALKLFPVE